MKRIGEYMTAVNKKNYLEVVFMLIKAQIYLTSGASRGN